MGGKEYEVSLVGISSATNPKASITINGQLLDSFTEGQTRYYAGGEIDVYVKTIFAYAGSAGGGYVEIQLGADKLTFESGKNVRRGNNDDSIKGTRVTMDSPSAMSSLKISVAAESNKADHILMGEEFVDPVFGTVKVNFASVTNGPVLSGYRDTSTSRGKLSIERGGNRELQITATDKSGKTATLPFTYQNNTGDNSGTVHVWEGATITQDDYFILNSGTNQHFMKMNFISLTPGGDKEDEVEFTDLFTGTPYKAKGNFTATKTQVISCLLYTSPSPRDS